MRASSQFLANSGERERVDSLDWELPCSIPSTRVIYKARRSGWSTPWSSGWFHLTARRRSSVSSIRSGKKIQGNREGMRERRGISVLRRSSRQVYRARRGPGRCSLTGNGQDVAAVWRGSLSANLYAAVASVHEGDKRDDSAVKVLQRWSSKAAGDVASPACCRACTARG
jgi:hypothetical protein